MARFFGQVGFLINTPNLEQAFDDEGEPIRQYVERPATGIVETNTIRMTRDGGSNQSAVNQTTISIIADAYFREYWAGIVYVIWRGIPHEVESVDDAYPRLKLRLGGRYNGELA